MLRSYALLADGERGALVGPRGDIAFLCAPRWHDDAVFSSLLGGSGVYAVTPRDGRHTWGGYYEPGGLIWRSRWVSTDSVIECREALAFPGDRDRLVLMRRVEGVQGTAQVHLQLECCAGFGRHRMSLERAPDGTWRGRSGGLNFRWSGAPRTTAERDGQLRADLDVAAGEHHDLILEISASPLPQHAPPADSLWQDTESRWQQERPDVGGSIAPGESTHSWAVLRGLTSSDGGMVAAATTSLPERADAGRDYDYRYAWVRDQCFAGLAASTVGAADLLDRSVLFVAERVHSSDGDLRPVYRVDGGEVPRQRRPETLPGYPGAPVVLGNRAGQQTQLDVVGEALLLMATADEADRLDTRGLRAVEALATMAQERAGQPEAGIWELDDRLWAHSRLICAAGLRAVAARRARQDGRRTSASAAGTWEQLADHLVEQVDRDCRHPFGRWQRSPHDPRVDAALLLPGIRGAVPPGDPRNERTVAAVRDELSDDGYVYRFRQDPGKPLHEAEGAFVLSGFHMALAELTLGRTTQALRWFERNRGVLGPPGLFAEEFDVVQRQLRGNLPQAFVHAAALETAQRLGQTGLDAGGFGDQDR